MAVLIQTDVKALPFSNSGPNCCFESCLNCRSSQQHLAIRAATSTHLARYLYTMVLASISRQGICPLASSRPLCDCRWRYLSAFSLGLVVRLFQRCLTLKMHSSFWMMLCKLFQLWPCGFVPLSSFCACFGYPSRTLSDGRMLNRSTDGQ